MNATEERNRLWRALLGVAFLLFLHSTRTAQAQGNVSELPYEVLHRPLDYAVIGQAKCGTSTLWWNLVQNPAIKPLGNTKESHFWQGEGAPSRCDASVHEYNAMAAATRIKHNRADILVGDWSATYFSCACCPGVLKTLNPSIKIVVMLRDPVKRALSRFIEQQRNQNFPLHPEVSGLTFAAYAEKALNTTQACLDRAALFEAAAGARSASGSGSGATGGADRLRGDSSSSGSSGSGGSGSGGSGSGARFAGYGMDMTLSEWMRMQCFQANSIVGWSAYDVFLENWMSRFPAASGQLLVVYTEDMAAQPLEVVTKVERFLGAPPHEHDIKTVTSVYNSRECYHWQCRRDKGEVRPLPEEGTLGHAVMRLVDFYRPHMRRLMTWADAGLIPPVPTSWRTTYR